MRINLTSGFTLVELVLVLVIIGLLSAVAIPKYIESNSVRELSEKQHVSGSVKTAWVIAKADIKKAPNVTTLAAYVQADQAAATGAGIMMQHNGESYIVPTYTDSNCTNPTHTANDLVACVGNIP